MVQIGTDYVTTSLVYYCDLYLVWSHNKNNCLRKTERRVTEMRKLTQILHHI